MEGFVKHKYFFSKVNSFVDVSEQAQVKRREQISFLIQELFSYKIMLKDLVAHFPKETERTTILNIAYFIIDNTEMFDRVLRRKELPFNRLSRATRTQRGFLEKWQDYIITYFLILSNPNYRNIAEYLRIDVNEDEVEQKKSALALINAEPLELYKGIVVQAKKNTAIIMTSSGEFIKIKKDEGLRVGSEVKGKEKKGGVHYKLHISLALVFIALFSCGLYANYNKVKTTVIINSTSQVKLKLNGGNKVIYTHSPSEKGNSMIDYADPMDKDIDSVLRDCLEYAANNEMIPKGGIIITVNGDPLEYGLLKETSKYVVNQNLQVQVNNVGSTQHIYHLAQE